MLENYIIVNAKEYNQLTSQADYYKKELEESIGVSVVIKTPDGKETKLNRNQVDSETATIFEELKAALETAEQLAESAQTKLKNLIDDYTTVSAKVVVLEAEIEDLKGSLKEVLTLEAQIEHLKNALGEKVDKLNSFLSGNIFKRIFNAITGG